MDLERLERLATAVRMTREHPGSSIRARAEALVRVNAHISHDAGAEAVEEIDALLEERRTSVVG